MGASEEIPEDASKAVVVAHLGFGKMLVEIVEGDQKGIRFRLNRPSPKKECEIGAIIYLSKIMN
jgi:hypothetical protein